MKTAIALRHLHFEDLGTLEPLLVARGYAVRYLDAPIDDLYAVDMAAADLLVVLGGPIGAFDDHIYPFLRDELAVVLQWLASGRPLLGICLGAQLIARALGASVVSMGVKEIGFAPLTLTQKGEGSPLAALGQTPVLHWHGDHFGIPDGATRLAGTQTCANQAFSIGRNVLAWRPIRAKLSAGSLVMPANWRRLASTCMRCAGKRKLCNPACRRQHGLYLPHGWTRSRHFVPRRLHESCRWRRDPDRPLPA